MKNNVYDMIKRGDDFKIRVTPEQSEKVQLAVFKAGGKWYDGDVNVSELSNSYLYSENNRISTSSGFDHLFDEYDLPEAFFPEDTKKLNEDMIKESSKRVFDKSIIEHNREAFDKVAKGSEGERLEDECIRLSDECVKLEEEAEERELHIGSIENEYKKLSGMYNEVFDSLNETMEALKKTAEERDRYQWALAEMKLMEIAK